MVKNVPSIFAHIPKTAGTTFYRIFSDHVDARKIFPYYFPEEKWNLRVSDDFDLFFTHITLMLRSGVFLHQRFNLFTCVRHPRNLVSSLYNHILREKNNPNLEFLEKLQGVDWYKRLPEEFSVQDLIEKDFLSSNIQVNWLANSLGGAATQRDFLVLAKIFLNSTKWFGIVERFDLSYSLLCAVNSWRPVPVLERENVGSAIAFPQGLQASMQENFAEDLELYNFADKLLEERAAILVQNFLKSETDFEFSSKNKISLSEKLTLIAQRGYAKLKGQESIKGPCSGILMAEAPFDGSGWHRREYDFKTRPYRWNGAAEVCDVDLPCVFSGGGHIFLSLIAWNPTINFSDIHYSVNGVECQATSAYVMEEGKTKVVVRVKIPKLPINKLFNFSRLVISNFSTQKLSSFTRVEGDHRSVGFAFQDVYYFCE
jgi:hypothetical protein